MTTLGALLSTLAGAWLLYAVSPRRLLLQSRQRVLVTRWTGATLIAAGTLLWLSVAGTGAGIAATLTELMLVWVALPYIAWWRRRAARVPAQRR
jgi:hypothetical protein